ncbi:NAD(P)-dependent oxidoreductase [Aquimarina sediminis]|uniref:NAD(P)-dependent oxidoreductase n=1 Tax=Aquimarina sediminis TaxID=2070536 RepID=UPI000CA069D8|nr:NAD(P)-dependent oxidoreductase [Aquimarina sediminis]
MGEYKRPVTEEDFEKNFKLKKPLMNATEVYYESSRCLYCYDAPCIQACPTGIDIPLFIKQLQTKNTEGAAKTIYDSNWLGNACGTVCPTGVLCEGACVYNHQDVPPLQIGRLQNYATTQVISKEKQLYTPGDDNGKKIAIIGAGPAGIACACELRVLGYQVTVYEAKEKPSGLTVYGIAPYKITNEEVLEEINYLQNQLGFVVKYNSPITKKEQLELLERSYDAIFLGVGLGKTSVLGLPGEDKKNVIGAVEFIEELRMKHHLLKVPNKVIVIGGGNTAMDAASEAARMGADEVILAYRRSKEEKGAYTFEYDLALSAGVKGMFNIAPVEITGEESATGVKFSKTHVVNGKLEEIEESEFVISCDLVIKATGQAKQKSFFDLIPDLEIDAKSRIIVKEDTNQTSNPKYFAGGDAINGGAEVVNGAYDGKLAAKGIHQWLTK